MKPNYDMSIHTNPDAQAWAKFFCDKYKIEGVDDTQDLMVAWFANAMMAMHDHLILKGAPINGDHYEHLLIGQGEYTSPLSNGGMDPRN